MSQPAPAHRFDELDGLRGVAVVVVLIGHYVSSIEEFYPQLPSSPWGFHEGRFGVQLFFMISGYVILMTAARSRRAIDFVIARVTRLYPAYWAALALALVLLAVAPPGPLSYTPLQALINVTMFQRYLLVPDIDPVYWTLAIELWFYIGVVILLLVTRGRLTDRLVRTTAVAVVAVSLATSLALHGRPLDFGAKVLLNLTNAEYAPLFCAGMLFYLSRRDHRLEPWALPFCAVAAINAALLHSAVEGWAISLVVLFFAAVVVVPRVPWLASGPLRYLGRISYSMYLLHTIPGFLTIVALTPSIGRPLATAVAVVTVTGLSIASHRFVEGTLSRRLRQVLARWANPRHVPAAEVAP